MNSDDINEGSDKQTQSPSASGTDDQSGEHNEKQSEKQSDQTTGAKQAQLPQTDFSMLVLSLSHSAFVHLGDAPSPDNEKRSQNLVLARQTIDLLEILSEKTKGNLTGQEERLLENMLYELRMRFVEVSKEKS